MRHPDRIEESLPDYRSPLQMSSTGYLLCALTETKENTLNPEGLKALLSQYAIDGVALMVWDNKSEVWIKLTKEMLNA